MHREPVVAGRFYEADPTRLNTVLDGYLSGAVRRTEPTILAMVPHAGYVYSGALCGQTLGTASLASTVLLIGPNHTGRGKQFSLWPEGEWAIPGGNVPIDTSLATVLLESNSMLSADTEAHIGEHSLEVVLPFLKHMNPDTTFVPIALSANRFEAMEEIGRTIGDVIQAFERPVSIIVSSDMSHYISHEKAQEMDSMALEACVELDPLALFTTVREKRISMCGVLPMTCGLVAACVLGAHSGELVGYTTSGDVTGDLAQVVGYAGILVS